MSDEAKLLNEQLQQRRAQLGVDDPKKVAPADEKEPAAADVDWTNFAPPWIARINQLDEPSARAWDERVRRINASVATEEDIRVQEVAMKCIAEGKPLPTYARKWPSAPELRTSHWRSSEHDTIERAVAIGIPPLIAERIVKADQMDTRALRACARVGRGRSIVVVIGELGCGKSYAAASWLWTLRYDPPDFMRARVKPRRFVDVGALTEIPFESRSETIAGYGLAVALAVDDAGVEEDFLVPHVAGVLVKRYRNHLPTVVTTNLNQKDFEERYGMRFSDRMREVGEFVVVSNDKADSLRGR